MGRDLLSFIPSLASILPRMRDCPHRGAGTKVGAVIYGVSNICLFSKLLTPYKRYYVSSAVVTRTDEKFRVSSYIYSWIISNKSLVEELVESIPTSLPCQFEFKKFSNLYKYADSESPQNVRGIVLQCFPSEEQGTPMITKRKKLFLLWNHFDENEGNKLAGMIGPRVMIFCMRFKMTTFNCLSLSTKGSLGFMIDPPVSHDLQMQEWYNENKVELEELLNKKSYKNSGILLPYPKDEDIISISTAVASLRTPSKAINSEAVVSSVLPCCPTPLPHPKVVRIVSGSHDSPSLTTTSYLQCLSSRYLSLLSQQIALLSLVTYES
ncbi:hypothetical protein Tco_0994671 [Tanacetum coccineum]